MYCLRTPYSPAYLHADERQIGGVADEGAQAACGEPGQCLLPQGDVLQGRGEGEGESIVHNGYGVSMHSI